MAVYLVLPLLLQSCAVVVGTDSWRGLSEREHDIKKKNYEKIIDIYFWFVVFSTIFCN